MIIAVIERLPPGDRGRLVHDAASDAALKNDWELVSAWD